MTSQGRIVGRHPNLLAALQAIERAAPSDRTVLVTGESGTGKELAVAALHDGSQRAKREIVTVNCAAILVSLLEIHLFGDARCSRRGSQGVLALAEGGTLFLDEIGELPLLSQTTIVRLLQQREYTPVGGTEARRCDIRVVAATNRDLEDEIAAGRFREDLYRELSEVRVHLPTLRERHGDIELLAWHFLKTVTARNGCEHPSVIARDAMELLQTYPWPGNVRELEICIERAVLLASGPTVTVSDLPPRVRDGSRRGPPPGGSPPLVN